MVVASRSELMNSRRGSVYSSRNNSVISLDENEKIKYQKQYQAYTFKRRSKRK